MATRGTSIDSVTRRDLLSLVAVVRDEVLRPGDQGYEEARWTWNRMNDRLVPVETGYDNENQFRRNQTVLPAAPTGTTAARNGAGDRTPAGESA